MSKKLPTTAARRFSNRRALLFASPLILMGVLGVLLTLYALVTRHLDRKTAWHMGAIIIACIGLPVLIIGRFTSKRHAAVAKLKAGYPDKPWMWREDWAGRRADNDVQRGVFWLWLAVAVFEVICVIALALMLVGVRGGHAGGWLGLAFPVVGVAVLVFAIRTSRAWGRFGRAYLYLGALPVTPGEPLTGEIRVPIRLQPRHAFYLRLSCLGRTATIRGRKRVTIERMLWQEEKWFAPTLPQPVAGATRIPVFFRLPAGLPASTLGTGDSVQWRLEAEADVSGPDFHGMFEVPVFKPVATAPAVGNAIPAIPAVAAAPLPATAAADLTQSHQLTLDQVRREIRSRIEIIKTPEGREIIFPAGRNPGFATGASVIWLVWTTAIFLMIVWRAPLVFPLVFAALDVLMCMFMLDLWLRRSSVQVTPAQVKIQTSWLSYRRETMVAAADIASLKADIGATAGHAAYYDLKIRTRAGREIVAAKNLNHKPEADWLIRQMAAVLKRAPLPAEGETAG